MRSICTLATHRNHSQRIDENEQTFPSGEAVCCDLFKMDWPFAYGFTAVFSPFWFGFYDFDSDSDSYPCKIVVIALFDDQDMTIFA